MKLFLHYQVRYSLQAAIITQVFWLLALSLITCFQGTAIAWNYIIEFGGREFLILSTVPAVVIALPIAALTAWQTRKAF